MKAQATAVLALLAISSGSAWAQKTGASWNDYLGGPAGAHYSPLTQINISNVSKIQPVWSYPAGDGLSVFCPA